MLKYVEIYSNKLGFALIYWNILERIEIYQNILIYIKMNWKNSDCSRIFKNIVSGFEIIIIIHIWQNIMLNYIKIW